MYSMRIRNFPPNVFCGGTKGNSAVDTDVVDRMVGIDDHDFAGFAGRRCDAVGESEALGFSLPQE